MALKDVLPGLHCERGLTQEQLAKRLFITRQALSRWETGETTPGIDMPKLIARELDVPITELLEMPELFLISPSSTAASRIWRRRLLIWWISLPNLPDALASS